MRQSNALTSGTFWFPPRWMNGEVRCCLGARWTDASHCLDPLCIRGPSLLAELTWLSWKYIKYSITELEKEMWSSCIDGFAEGEKREIWIRRLHFLDVILWRYLDDKWVVCLLLRWILEESYRAKLRRLVTAHWMLRPVLCLCLMINQVRSTVCTHCVLTITLRQAANDTHKDQRQTKFGSENWDSRCAFWMDVVTS